MNELRPLAKPARAALWTFVLNATLSFLLLVMMWWQVVDLVAHERLPVTDAEAEFLVGLESGGAGCRSYPVLKTLVASDVLGENPLVVSRSLNAVALLLLAAVLALTVWRLAGPLLVAACLVLFFASPQTVSSLMATPGASWAALCFAGAFSLLSLRTPGRSSVWAGVLASLSLLLDVTWALPLLGLVVGSRHLLSKSWPTLLAGLLLGLLGGGGLALYLDPAFFAAHLLPGVFFAEPALAWSFVRAQVYLLLVALVFLWCGADRRGLWWWTLLFSCANLPLALLSGPASVTVFIPFLLLCALAFTRLPALLEINFPSVYQAGLAVILLTWLPAYLQPESYVELLERRDATEVTGHQALMNLVRESRLPVLTEVPGLHPEDRWVPVEYTGAVRRSAALFTRWEQELREKHYGLVVLDLHALPPARALPVPLRETLARNYEENMQTRFFSLWMPRAGTPEAAPADGQTAGGLPRSEAPPGPETPR